MAILVAVVFVMTLNHLSARDTQERFSQVVKNNK
jgi:hypothetical protein